MSSNNQSVLRYPALLIVLGVWCFCWARVRELNQCVNLRHTMVENYKIAHCGRPGPNRVTNDYTYRNRICHE